MQRVLAGQIAGQNGNGGGGTREGNVVRTVWPRWLDGTRQVGYVAPAGWRSSSLGEFLDKYNGKYLGEILTNILTHIIGKYLGRDNWTQLDKSILVQAMLQMLRPS